MDGANILDIRQVRFVLNQVLNLLAASVETKINVVRFDDFVLLDRPCPVDLVDMQMGYPTDCPVPMISVHSAMDAMAHENVAYKSVVYCVMMTFVMRLQMTRNKKKI